MPVFYTVQPKDTMWRIAERYKIALHDLVRANNLLRPDMVYPGDTLFLPYPVSLQYETYTVRSGDTLTRIAISYKTTITNLVRVNKLENPDHLYVGQRLRVSRGPELWGDEEWIYQTYAVMPGDTLWAIAQRAGVNMWSLVKLNKLQNPNWVNPGTLLIIRQQVRQP